jgi:hypothetical protein
MDTIGKKRIYISAWKANSLRAICKKIWIFTRKTGETG